MGELRQQPLTGRWSVIAPGRAARPFDTVMDWSGLPEREPACPFCPGNEAELPRVLWEDEGPDGRWRVRSVRNRYPALASATDEPHPGLAVGTQEVLIETPVHGLDPSLMTARDMGVLVRAYRKRYRALAVGDPEAHVILFKNRGLAAGNSLVHPHAQLYALRGPAPEIDNRHRLALAGWTESGRCLLCGLDRLEPEYGARVVAETRAFRAVVPWAAAATGQVWIVPRAHRPSFGLCSDDELEDFAAHLGAVLEGLRVRAGDPAYNLLWHGGRMSQKDAPHLHWHLEIRPRTHRRAGFELASGVDICPSDPVLDAAALRG